MRRYLFAALCLTTSAGASAHAICTQYGEMAAGFAMQRDQGVSKKSLADKINAPVAGGLTEDNKKISLSLLNVAYSRTDMKAIAIGAMVESACEEKYTASGL